MVPKKKNLMKTKSEAEKFLKQKKEKKFVKIFSKFFFFFDFPKKISVEIFYMMSTLRMQNYTIIGQGVPEISVRTHRLSPGFII